MKLSNERILKDIPQLAAISQKQLPIKASYAIAKNIAKIESELNIYNKEREKLMDKYCEKDSQGKPAVDKNNQIKLKEGCIGDWNKDINELLQIENDIEIHKFHIDLLDGCKMSPQEFTAIEYMVEE